MDNRTFKIVYIVGLAFFAFLQLVDFSATYYHVNYMDGFAESNPMMAPYVGDFFVFLLLKVLCVLIIVSMAEVLRRKNHIVVAIAAIWLATGFGVGVVWSNALQVVYLLY